MIHLWAFYRLEAQARPHRSCKHLPLLLLSLCRNILMKQAESLSNGDRGWRRRWWLLQITYQGQGNQMFQLQSLKHGSDLCASVLLIRSQKPLPPCSGPAVCCLIWCLCGLCEVCSHDADMICLLLHPLQFCTLQASQEASVCSICLHHKLLVSIWLHET